MAKNFIPENAQRTDRLERELAAANATCAEHERRAERRAEVLAASQEAVFIFDSGWRVTYANPRAAQLLHRDDAELPGLLFSDLFSGVGAARFEARLRAAAEAGEQEEFEDKLPSTGAWASVRAVPVLGGLALLVQDRSRQHRAELANDDSARRLRLALESGQLGTWTWDRVSDNLDLDERAAILFHAEAHKPISRSALRERVVAVSDRRVTLDQLSRSLESGDPYTAEYRLESSDGQETWICASGLPTGTPGNSEIDGMVGIVQDITARKAQEAALRQSEKLAATGRLAATIAHEINNPLEAITNLIYLAKTDPETPPAVQRQLDIADAELARVALIAQGTLGFYRDTTRPVSIDLNELISAVLELFSRRLIRKKIECNVDLAPNLRVFGLQGEIRQVFSNLLVNAIDASDDGLISLRGRPARCCRSGRDGVSVLVSDRGSGIALPVRPRLFSPFFTTKESVGTGLGLWVTRGIVEKHGGVVAFRSCTEAPSGTVFRVFLPAGSPDQTLLARSAGLPVQ